MTKRFFSENISPNDYAETAVLARMVGEQLLVQLEFMTLQPQKILDTGCGTGYCTTLLKQRYPNAEIIAVDNSQTLLQFAKQQYPTIADWVYADATTTSLQKHSIDLIFANLLLPWCDDLEKVLQEWRRVLRPGGLLMFTALGPDTLRELLLPSSHLPNFMDMHNVGDALLHNGFADPVLDVEYITLTYRDLAKLTYEMRATGMVIDDGSLLSVEKNPQGVFALTHEIIYGHAWGAAATQNEPGVFKIPLADLRR